MTPFQTRDEILTALIALEDKNDTPSFIAYQHFLFACCDHLRHEITWPKVRDAYNKCKLGLGSKSVFMAPPQWRDFSAFRGKERKSAQYVVYQLFADLQEFQEAYQLIRRSWYLLDKLFSFIPLDRISAIWKDTIISFPKYQKPYPLAVRRMGWEIREAGKYEELPVLGDMCEDMNLMEEADHFRDPTCLHTYGCRYLWHVAKGMDGR